MFGLALVVLTLAWFGNCSTLETAPLPTKIRSVGRGTGGSDRQGPVSFQHCLSLASHEKQGLVTADLKCPEPSAHFTLFWSTGLRACLRSLLHTNPALLPADALAQLLPGDIVSSSGALAYMERPEHADAWDVLLQLARTEAVDADARLPRGGTLCGLALMCEQLNVVKALTEPRPGLADAAAGVVGSATGISKSCSWNICAQDSTGEEEEGAKEKAMVCMHPAHLMLHAW